MRAPCCKRVAVMTGVDQAPFVGLRLSKELSEPSPPRVWQFFTGERVLHPTKAIVPARLFKKLFEYGGRAVTYRVSYAGQAVVTGDGDLRIDALVAASKAAASGFDGLASALASVAEGRDVSPGSCFIGRKIYANFDHAPAMNGHTTPAS